MQVGERIQASKDLCSVAQELQEETRIAGKAVLLTRGADRCVAWPLLNVSVCSSKGRTWHHVRR